MLYLSVAFIALTAIKQWNPLPSHHAAIHCSDSSHHGYHDALYTCDSFADLVLTLDINVMGYFATGLKTHTTGVMTHNFGLTTHNPHTGLTTHDALTLGLRLTQCQSSIEGEYHLMPGCHSIVSSKGHLNVSTYTNMTKKKVLPILSMPQILSYPSCLCHNIIFLSAVMENHPIVFIQEAFNSMTAHKLKSNRRFEQKLHKHYKCSSLPLVLAINRCIYYLLNGTFDQVNVVNHLINTLPLMLQRYITRKNDFNHRWLTLLQSGLLSLQHISVWFLIDFIFWINIIVWKLIWFRKILYTMNLIINTIMVLFYHPSKLRASNQNIKLATSFVGGGSSARTDY